ncbi:hypothetical protein [Deinococcus sonorensis]|uniref:ZU5 domain-containing protein n=2 Tax=Deinococcus sonorensis TaxID=309891 RepID=A0AAU7U4I4_9DEIO
MRMSFLIATTLILLSACGGAPGGGASGPPTPPLPPTPSPVGTPLGAATTATIGAAGGSLSLPGNTVRIDIPAGALSADTQVGIQEISDTAPGQHGHAYRLTPEGTTFAKPARLTFSYTDQDTLNSAPQALSIAYQDHAGVWQMYRKPARDLAAQTVSVETTHFSDWSMVQGVQLLPLKATVRVGEALALRVVHCDQPPQDEDDLFVPLPGTAKNECGYALASLTARNWAVNSAAGGNSSVGTVSATGATGDGTAQYTAPATRPPRNPVAVTVDVDDPLDGPFTLVSNVTVTDSTPQWQGTVTYTESGSKPWNVQSNFVGSGMETFKQVHTYKVVGVKEVDGPRTTLIFEQQGEAEYTDNGSIEKQVYSQCVVFGPVILRYDTVYQKAMQMAGSVTHQAEEDLHIDDGQYSLYVSGEDIPMKGQEKVTSYTKYGCTTTVDDSSYVKPWNYLQGPQDAKIEGHIDPAHPDTLTGGYDATSSMLGVSTHIRVDWNLHRSSP